jgi:penicillin amidase
MARWWAGLGNTNTSGGAMFAAVVDVGNWDATQAISAPGQSGDPRSVHYADTYRAWLTGEYRALPFSPAAVDAAAQTRLRLVPRGE